MSNDQERYRTILIFGAPGSGKGTQGRILGDIPGFFHLACGDVFRSLNPESQLGKTFVEYSSKGNLVPDKITLDVWEDHIRNRVEAGDFRPGSETLVLDGIPRSLEQARMIERYIDVCLLIYLEAVDENELIRRVQRRALQENRLDDASESVVRNRLGAYSAETAPLLDFYPADLIRNVDAAKSPIEVVQEVLAAVRGSITTPL